MRRAIAQRSGWPWIWRLLIGELEAPDGGVFRQRTVQPKEGTHEQSIGHGTRGGRTGGAGECRDWILRNDFCSKCTEGVFQVFGQLGLHERPSRGAFAEP